MSKMMKDQLYRAYVQALGVAERDFSILKISQGVGDVVHPAIIGKVFVEIRGIEHKKSES